MKFYLTRNLWRHEIANDSGSVREIDWMQTKRQTLEKELLALLKGFKKKIEIKYFIWNSG